MTLKKFLGEYWTAIAIIVGGIFWLASLDSRVSAVGADYTSLKTDVQKREEVMIKALEKNADDHQKIISGLSKIEGKLEEIRR